MKEAVYIGWDPREATACQIAATSLTRRASRHIPVHSLVLADLRDRGLYRRPMEHRVDGQGSVMWDLISDAPMATQHANARFLVPHLARTGWALFMDGDVLVRGDIAELFDALDPAKAVYCVHHHHQPVHLGKMDGQLQTRYERKNWSSVMAINCQHEANAALTLDLINSAPGRELHRFCWLPDDLIGDLAPEWNFLVGHSDPAIDPKIVHFTEGTPDMPGYEAVAYSAEWRAELRRMAA